VLSRFAKGGHHEQLNKSHALQGNGLASVANTGAAAPRFIARSPVIAQTMKAKMKPQFLEQWSPWSL
jgi:hypothetical protein